MLFYAIASLREEMAWAPSKSRKQARFLIITTACQYDQQIEKTIKSVLAQDYDEKNFDMVLVGDNLPALMNMKLTQYPITFFRTQMENGNKLKALQYAISHMSALKIYDLVILLDPDETIGTHFLQKVNRSYQLGYRMMQAHRTDFDRQTSSMILATTFEEINNSVFRIGHNNVGLSSALVGSGLCADYNWFRNNIGKISGEDEEKELEVLILQQRLYVDFLSDAFVYVDQVARTKDFNAQRRRWIWAQFKSLRRNIRSFVPAIINGNYDLADKILQWMLIPRTILVSILTFMSILLPILSWSDALKWWLATLLFLLMCAIATPDYLVNEEWIKAYRKVPVLIWGSLTIPFHGIVRSVRSVFVREKKDKTV